MLPADRQARLLALAFLALAPLAYGWLALRFGMDANWDLRNYHWYNAHAFLTGRIGFDLLPAQIPSFYNPLLDVPFYLAATAWPAPVAGFLLATAQGVNAALLFLLGFATLRVGGERTRVVLAMILAALGMLGGGALGLIGTTFNDNLASLGVLGALALIVARLPRPALPAVLIAGLLAGAAAGLKSTTITYGLALGVGLLALPGPVPRRLGLAAGFGAAALLGLGATGGFWMWHLWQEYGNPTFPYMNHVFRSPYAALSDYRHPQFIPEDWTDRLLLPLRMALEPLRVGEVPFRDIKIPVLYALAPAAALLAVFGYAFGRGPRRPDPIVDAGAGRMLLVVAAAAFALWLLLFCIYRYLIPLEMLSPLLIVVAAGLLPVGRRMRLGLAALLLVAAQVAAVPGNWGRVAWSERWVEAGIPPIPHPERTMLLMAGYWATSHVVTLFPPAMPVMRIQSNFVQPDSTDNALRDVLAKRVAAHDGDFLVLATIPDTALAAEAVAQFGLALHSGTCRPVPNNLGETLNLCDVSRGNATSHDREKVGALTERL